MSKRPLYFDLIIFISTLPDTCFFETGLIQFEEESSYTKNGSKVTDAQFKLPIEAQKPRRMIA